MLPSTPYGGATVGCHSYFKTNYFGYEFTDTKKKWAKRQGKITWKDELFTKY